MPASTGILKRFDLTYVSPNGVVLSFPINNVVPKYNHIPLVLNAFKTYEKRLSDLGVRYAGEVNKIVCKGEIADFIQTNEILVNLMKYQYFFVSLITMRNLLCKIVKKYFITN